MTISHIVYNDTSFHPLQFAVCTLFSFLLPFPLPSSLPLPSRTPPPLCVYAHEIECLPHPLHQIVQVKPLLTTDHDGRGKVSEAVHFFNSNLVNLVVALYGVREGKGKGKGIRIRISRGKGKGKSDRKI